MVCGEIGEGGNLFGVFRKGPTISAEEVASRLAGNGPELSGLEANSDADYFGRASTWLKLAPKMFSQVEERCTAGRFKGAAGLFRAGLRNVRALMWRLSSPVWGCSGEERLAGFDCEHTHDCGDSEDIVLCGSSREVCAGACEAEEQLSVGFCA